jgi:hypothetical protein
MGDSPADLMTQSSLGRYDTANARLIATAQELLHCLEVIMQDAG